MQLLPKMLSTQLSLVSCWQPPLRGQNSAKQLESSACTGTKNACTPLPGCIELADVSDYLFAVAAKLVSHSAGRSDLLAVAVTGAELSKTKNSCTPLPGCIELAEVSGYLFAVAAKHVSHSAEPGELLAAAVTSAELSNTAGSERPHRHQECVHTPARVHRAC